MRFLATGFLSDEGADDHVGQEPGSFYVAGFLEESGGQE
jgi:hypothetical protein